MNKKVRFLTIGLIAVLILTISSTLAGWVVNEKQTNYNNIKAGCINLSFSSGTGSLTLQNATPMTDSQGLNLTGYTFTVKNNCNSEVSYLLNLDMFNVAGSTNLTAGEIKLAIDNQVPRKLSMYDNTAKNDNTAYGAKNLYSGKLAAKSSDTHTIKMWVDESVVSQNAVFSNRLFTMANPNLTVPVVPDDDCFIMDGNGTILMYKTALCPNKIIVPNVIQNQTVTGIGYSAFVDANVLTVYHDDIDTLDFIILDEEHYSTISSILTAIIQKDMNDNGAIEGNIANYAIYQASTYANWNDFDPSILGFIGTIDDFTGQSTGVNSHRLNVPLDLDVDEFWDCWGVFFEEALATDIGDTYGMYQSQLLPYEPERYLEYIDLSRCTSLTSLECNAINGNYNLTNVELPNNSTFEIKSEALYLNGLTKAFIPTHATTIGSRAYKDNAISYVELYSTNNLSIDTDAFLNNNISNLVVNSTVTTIGKPFNNNQLTSAGITIGYNSTNTASDFITIN